MKRVYISVINDLATDQRVGRVALMLKEQGLEVTCIGRRLRNSPELHGAGYNLRRYRMLFKKGPLFYVCFNLRLLMTLLSAKKPSLFISNDLDTLPASFMASRIRKVKLIYDSHEFFTQVPELIHRRRVQGIWKRIENHYIPRLEYAVTVSYPIAEIYRKLYGTKFNVVRNFPVKRDISEGSKTRMQNKYKGKQCIIYQGALNIGRGLELMIEAMQYVDNAIFIVAGTGDIDQELRTMVNEMGLTGKVKFKGRLLPEQLFPITDSCDIGISLEEDLGLNYRYALPNKIFDYIQSRVPVLCSALPEMSRIVRTYGVGIATEERNPKKLAGIIKFMLEERANGAWKGALDKSADELCWENESQVYLDILGQVGVLSDP